MKREIKFRAWDNVQGVMLYNIQNAYDTLCGVTDENGNDMDYDEINFGNFCQLPRYEVMQYTGLKDKNGKEIYEGDVVKSGREFLCIVVYQAPSFVMKIKQSSKTWFEFLLSAKEYQFETVIGNIYETPDLIPT